MAQRTVCLCNGKYIGIETIFSVVDGKQINIPEKLKELRAKSQNNELFCPCGCGANLILVAGDKNLREQHFRLKDSSFESECHVVTEGKTSVNSKIVLKCWLHENLKTDDIETRVPIKYVGDTERKYEFSFLSRTKKVAVSYCHERANLSDEKFEILEANSRDIQLIYIVDVSNRGSNGQYPEALMKIQDRQGYCLFLEVNNSSYDEAKMRAVFYIQDYSGLWREVQLAKGRISDYTILAEGQIVYRGKLLTTLLAEKSLVFEQSQQEEKQRREIEEKRRLEERRKIQEEYEYRRLEYQKKLEEAEKERIQRQEEVRQRRKREEDERQAEKKRRDEDFRRNMESNFSQQQTPVRDGDGNRWIKCEICGLIAKEGEFPSYGGKNHVNLGLCRECFPKASTTGGKVERVVPTTSSDPTICPNCGGKLREKNGRFGKFIGCSNFPKCGYTRNSRKR